MQVDFAQENLRSCLFYYSERRCFLFAAIFVVGFAIAPTSKRSSIENWLHSLVRCIEHSNPTRKHFRFAYACFFVFSQRVCVCVRKDVSCIHVDIAVVGGFVRHTQIHATPAPILSIPLYASLYFAPSFYFSANDSLPGLPSRAHCVTPHGRWEWMAEPPMNRGTCPDKFGASVMLVLLFTTMKFAFP